MKYLILFFLLFTFVGSSFAQERFVKPSDDAVKDRSFLQFRAKLIAALEKKDTKYLYSVIDPGIKASFGGDDTLADFKELWKPESKDSKIWAELLTVLKNGGTFDTEGGDSRMFMAPYSFTNFPEDLDAFEHMMIFGNNVNLRESASITSKVKEKLSYNVVTITGSTMKPDNKEVVDWYQVKTLGGKTGWVKAEYVRSPIDFRAGFEKKRGQWKLIFFVAGD